MEQLKLGIGALPGTDKTVCQQLVMIRQIGFDAFFTRWDASVGEYRRLAEDTGLEYAFLHGPNRYSQQMWTDSPEAELGVEEWFRCLEDCAAHKIPMVIAHAYKGLTIPAVPRLEGLRNYGRILERAKELGVMVALENAEGNACLGALLDAYAGDRKVGFCWDTGHTLCYSSWENLGQRYGDRLVCTHLHDNMGIRGKTGECATADDLHLLPFDGKVPWQEVTDSLRASGYRGILMLEVKKKCYPDMDTRVFLEEAYRRGCRLREMCGGL